VDQQIFYQMNLGKFSEILEGFSNLAKLKFGGDLPPDIKVEASQRAVICADCPHNVDNRCKICGCFLAGKTLSMQSSCPDDPKRWESRGDLFLKYSRKK
jgi:hypothetical protein